MKALGTLMKALVEQCGAGKEVQATRQGGDTGMPASLLPPRALASVSRLVSLVWCLSSGVSRLEAWLPPYLPSPLLALAL